jgi:DNA mismatch endonuclease (patch repair protein)
MAERISKEERSLIMRKVKSKNTGPELLVRKLLYQNGYRYRINYKQLPGKPDIVLKKYNTVIFVNGCFWHGHSKCKKSKRPRTNRSYWENKIDRNIERDKQNRRKLKGMGYKVVTIWECELKKPELMLKRMITVFEL